MNFFWTKSCYSNNFLQFLSWKLWFYLYEYFSCHDVSVSLFVSNKRQNGLPIRPTFLWDLTGPRGWMIKIKKFASTNIRFPQNFENPRFVFIKSANYLFFFYNVYKEKRFTFEIVTMAQPSNIIYLVMVAL